MEVDEYKTSSFQEMRYQIGATRFYLARYENPVL